MLIGVTALPVAYLAAIKAPAWHASTLVWNALGFIDRVLGVALGVASSPGIPFGFANQSANGGLPTTLLWILIPCFNVPLLAHRHLLIFQRLRQVEAQIGDRDRRHPERRPLQDYR